MGYLFNIGVRGVDEREFGGGVEFLSGVGLFFSCTLIMISARTDYLARDTEYLAHYYTYGWTSSSTVGSELQVLV